LYLQILRDEADIKNRYGDGILPSYPIKVTFLHFANKERDIKWALEDVGLHIIRILREVEYRGAEHKLCSLFLEGDDEISEGDRSYLESRRVLKSLEVRAGFHSYALSLMNVIVVLGFWVNLLVSLLPKTVIMNVLYNDVPLILAIMRMVYTLSLFVLLVLLFPMMKPLFGFDKKRHFFKLYPILPLFFLTMSLAFFIHWIFIHLPPNVVGERVWAEATTFFIVFSWCSFFFYLLFICLSLMKLSLKRPEREVVIFIAYAIPPLLLFKWKSPLGEEQEYIVTGPSTEGKCLRFSCLFFLAGLIILGIIAIVTIIVYLPLPALQYQN
jgi:hypothetical protein